MTVLRTASRSPLAQRPAPRQGRSHEDSVLAARGVDLAGLGCSLAEWDAIAATMPPELRPARGNWNGSFERAAIAYHRALSAPAPTAAPSSPTTAESAPFQTRTPRRQEKLATVIRAIADAAIPRTARELARATGLSLNVVYSLLRELRAQRLVVTTSMVEHAPHMSSANLVVRYALAESAADLTGAA